MEWRQSLGSKRVTRYGTTEMLTLQDDTRRFCSSISALCPQFWVVHRIIPGHISSLDCWPQAVRTTRGPQSPIAFRHARPTLRWRIRGPHGPGHGGSAFFPTPNRHGTQPRLVPIQRSSALDGTAFTPKVAGVPVIAQAPHGPIRYRREPGCRPRFHRIHRPDRSW